MSEKKQSRRSFFAGLMLSVLQKDPKHITDQEAVQNDFDFSSSKIGYELSEKVRDHFRNRWMKARK